MTINDSPQNLTHLACRARGASSIFPFCNKAHGPATSHCNDVPRLSDALALLVAAAEKLCEMTWFKYVAREIICASVNGPPCAAAKAGIMVCGLPMVMIVFQ